MKNMIKFFGIVILSIVLVFSLIIYHFFFSMSNIPKGTFIKQFISPSGKYDLNAYSVDGGSLSNDGIRVEIVWRNGYKKNIYWDFPQDLVEITWINDHTVLINNHKIDIDTEVYDWRRQSVKQKILDE